MDMRVLERKIINTHFLSSTQMNCFSASTWQTVTLRVTSGSRFTVNGTWIFLFLFADERMSEKEGICVKDWDELKIFCGFVLTREQSAA